MSASPISTDIPAACRRERYAMLVSCTILILISLPLLAGLANTLQSAFFNDERDFIGFARWWDFAHQPGFIKAALLSLWTGIASTALAFLMASLLCQYLLNPHNQTSGLQRWLYRGVRLIMAFPHVAFAVGILILLAPSGSLIRWLSPWLTGLERPPLWTTTQDPYGFSLIIGLAFKEAAFLTLTLMTLAAQAPLMRQFASMQSMGYSFAAYWWKLALPELYRQCRLPLLIVLSFSVAVVELALILGPNTPPTLSVMVWQFFTDARLTEQAAATAGALILALLVVLSFLLWWLGERLISWGLGYWRINGQREVIWALKTSTNRVFVMGLWIFGLLLLISLIITAFSWRWPFTSWLPSAWQIKLWADALSQMGSALGHTLWLGVLTALLATVLMIVLLECLAIYARRWLDRISAGLMYLPLILPPLVFLVGVQLSLLRQGWDGYFGAVLIGHLIYAMPYTYLVLRGPWQAHDPMQSLHARLLTGSAWSAFIFVKLPQLKASIAFAMALALSVSVAQYLTTLMLGGGRWPTITTEAVSLSAGGDHRLLAIVVIIQALIPLIGFSLAHYVSQRSLSPSN